MDKLSDQQALAVHLGHAANFIALSEHSENPHWVATQKALEAERDRLMAEPTSKIVMEQTLRLDSREDSGMALIGENFEHTPSEDNGFFARLQSWDVTKAHKVFNELLGRRVRVTVEVIERSPFAKRPGPWLDGGSLLSRGPGRAPQQSRGGKDQ